MDSNFIYYILIVFFHVQKIATLKLLHGPYHPSNNSIYKCTSKIYCQGDLLDQVQSSTIYYLPSTFVNKRLIQNQSITINNFMKLQNEHNFSIPKLELQKFIRSHFTDENLLKWTLPDFNHFPSILSFVKDPTYKEFLSGLNQLWKDLAKKMLKNTDQELHSLIYVPNGYLVNKETSDDFYYMDLFWIVRGALICGMKNAVKEILSNCIYLIDKFGYMPTANRIYYEGRSQLPILTQMMATYYTFTNDKSFIIDNIWILDDEMMFWLTHRTINVTCFENIYKMSHYMNDGDNTPRPEWFKLDKDLSFLLKTKEDQTEFFRRIRATTESGWGLSSKHFHNRNDYDDIRRMLLKTNPLNFAYVELNSVMQSNANILSNMFLLIKDEVNYEFYKIIARRFQIGINALLWNEDEKMWLDFDSSTTESRNYFYASNLAPLWTGSYDDKLSEFYGDAAVDYLIRNKIINEDLTPRYLCIPTSLYNTGFDWDYHNCWPQLQSMVIFGLQGTRSERAKRVALNLASSWVNTVYVEYKKIQTLSVKYDAVILGKRKYRTGSKISGVTMGSIFEMFHTWGDILQSSPYKLQNTIF